MCACYLLQSHIFPTANRWGEGQTTIRSHELNWVTLGLLAAPTTSSYVRPKVLAAMTHASNVAFVRCWDMMPLPEFSNSCAKRQKRGSSCP